MNADAGKYAGGAASGDCFFVVPGRGGRVMMVGFASAGNKAPRSGCLTGAVSGV
jgi:hypothetical protein